MSYYKIQWVGNILIKTMNSLMGQRPSMIVQVGRISTSFGSGSVYNGNVYGIRGISIIMINQSGDIKTISHADFNRESIMKDNILAFIANDTLSFANMTSWESEDIPDEISIYGRKLKDFNISGSNVRIRSYEYDEFEVFVQNDMGNVIRHFDEKVKQYILTHYPSLVDVIITPAGVYHLSPSSNFICVIENEYLIIAQIGMIRKMVVRPIRGDTFTEEFGLIKAFPVYDKCEYVEWISINGREVLIIGTHRGTMLLDPFTEFIIPLDGRNRRYTLGQIERNKTDETYYADSDSYFTISDIVDDIDLVLNRSVLLSMNRSGIPAHIRKTVSSYLQ
jgi:hypothetical protein